VNLPHLRSLAKRLKTQHELDTAARLLATLVCKPKAFSAAELHVNVVKPSRHAEELRLGWKRWRRPFRSHGLEPDN
jgi:hypothetical protein